jgi:hypothetical protein
MNSAAEECFASICMLGTSQKDTSYKKISFEELIWLKHSSGVAVGIAEVYQNERVSRKKIVDDTRIKYIQFVVFIHTL